MGIVSGTCPALYMSHSTPLTWPSDGHYHSHFIHVEPEAIKLGSRCLENWFQPTRGGRCGSWDLSWTLKWGEPVYGMFLSVFSISEIQGFFKMQVICRPGIWPWGAGSQGTFVWEFLVLVGSWESHINEILDKLKQRTNTHFCLKKFIDQWFQNQKQPTASPLGPFP